MSRSESPASPVDYGDVPFYFVQRRSRSLASYLGLLFCGAIIVAPPAIGIIRRISPFGSQGLFYLVELPLMLMGAFCLLVTLPPVLKNHVDELIVDRSGIRYKLLSWTWDDLAWIGPAGFSSGGTWLGVKSRQSPRVLFRLALGSPLSFEKFEQVMQRIQSWTSVHAPNVVVEATIPPRARKAALWRAGITFAIAIGMPAFLFGSHALANYRHSRELRLIILASALIGLYAGIRELRGS